jgi:predicted nucleic acid-binding Zn ribbon protein
MSRDSAGDRKGPRKPARVGDALSAFLEQSGLTDRIEQATVVPDWASLVGEQIASVTEPLSVSRDGTLFVAVTTNSWMNELSLMEPQLLAALNAKPGRTKVVKIHWRLQR